MKALHPSFFETALVVCWSSGFIGAVLASDTKSVFTVLLWRFVLASVLLFPFLVPYLRPAYGRMILMHAIIGALAMFGYLATGIRAIDIGVPAGVAALVAALQPLVTAVFAGVVLRDSVSGMQWGGLFIGLAGVALAVGGGLGDAPLLGYALSFASMLCIVAASLITKKSRVNLPLLPTLAVQCIVSALLFLVTAAASGSVTPETSYDFWFAVIWFVVFSTAGAYGFYWMCLQQSSAVRVASLIYLTPPITMIWAWLMFDQQISMAAVIGLCICFAGVFIAARAQRSIG